MQNEIEEKEEEETIDIAGLSRGVLFIFIVIFHNQLPLADTKNP